MVGQTKTIEKTSSLIEKPLENHRYQWFARPKTIDTDGCFPTIHSKAQVNMKTLECCKYKANNRWFYLFLLIWDILC